MESLRIDQFFLGCLAHASYMVGSGGVAAVIDPQRDVDIYLDAAGEAGLRIEHIIETHLHADFVSGHHELAARTGARIYLGEGSGATFPHTTVKEGGSIQFGKARFDFMQTPGHTIESVCAVLTDVAEPGHPRAIFTGDTLFVGDVGRPDLSGDHTPQELAAMLYKSLHEKLLKLPDETEIFPAHGAGSLCGRQMSSERSSTIGKERRTNYALQAKSADEFVSLLTESLPPRPEYFGRDVELNRRGADALDHLPPLKPLQAAEVVQMQAEGAVVLDTRPAMDFAVAHVPGSVHIALSGQYASWAARILGLDKRIILVGEDAEHLRESQLRLARVGIDKADAYLEDGISGWVKSGYELDYIPQISAAELAEMREQEPVTVLDVREATEVEDGAIENSIRIPLGQLSARTGELDREKLMVVHCKGGYRSSIATSILRHAGFRDIANLTGGYDAWLAQKKEVEGTNLISQRIPTA
ncbi:MBL fold metallo-hydrolase [Alloacidobacterium sp.]|uniref:MBL fold metallo-hydrolase n=1 Tax=Alloacidobacterium sp. TaxID=2951999 RepID=UPI002D612ADE|nr:MBL fold metallo-hydrolase [Alloacidobacterium sp.]HYK34869.1 MBL fold metallo-hydrolase [Alloacidobacterium sp.]